MNLTGTTDKEGLDDALLRSHARITELHLGRMGDAGSREGWRLPSLEVIREVFDEQIED